MEKPQPIIVSDLFQEILDQLLELLSNLSEEDWQKPTVCEGWSVKDVALHLLGVDVGNLSYRRDNHSLLFDVSSWEELVARLNQMNQEWVQTTRRMSNRVLIDLLQVAGAQMCQYFKTMNPYAMGGPVSWAGPDPAPVWLDLAREYVERWHHQQHIRDAVGQPGLKQPRFLFPILRTCAWALPQAFRPVPVPVNTSVALTVTGDAGGSWSIIREDRGWQLYEGLAPRVDAEVTMDQDLAWRLYTKGVSHEFAREHSTLKGDQDLGNQLFRAVALIA